MRTESADMTREFKMKNGNVYTVKRLVDMHNVVLCKAMVYVPTYKKIMAKYFCIGPGILNFTIEHPNPDKYAEVWGRSIGDNPKNKKELVYAHVRTDFYTTKKDALRAGKVGRYITTNIGFYFHEEPRIFNIEGFFTKL